MPVKVFCPAVARESTCNKRIDCLCYRPLVSSGERSDCICKSCAGLGSARNVYLKIWFYNFQGGWTLVKVDLLLGTNVGYQPTLFIYPDWKPPREQMRRGYTTNYRRYSSTCKRKYSSAICLLNRTIGSISAISFQKCPRRKRSRKGILTPCGVNYICLAWGFRKYRRTYSYANST